MELDAMLAFNARPLYRSGRAQQAMRRPISKSNTKDPLTESTLTHTETRAP